MRTNGYAPRLTGTQLHCLIINYLVTPPLYDTSHLWIQNLQPGFTALKRVLFIKRRISTQPKLQATNVY